MFKCLHPDCNRKFEDKQGRNFHFSVSHDDSKEIALELLSESEDITYDNCSNIVGLSSAFYEENFNSWNRALELAEIKKNKEHNISDEKLLNELRDMSTDGVVRYNEMNKHGQYSARLYELRFGSWNNALKDAGLDTFDQFGKDNPCWKGGHEKYRGPNWEEAKSKTRKRANNTCENPECDVTKNKLGKKLDTHHIIPYRYYNSSEDANKLDNLVLLCPKHHREEESRIWRIESIETVK
jgi:hypothetical protein